MQLSLTVNHYIFPDFLHLLLRLFFMLLGFFVSDAGMLYFD